MEMVQPRTSILILVAVIVIASGTAGYLWISMQKPQRYEGPVEKVTLGVETSLRAAAVWVAEDKGYFLEEGLELDIRLFDSGKLSFLAMLEGEVDMRARAQNDVERAFKLGCNAYLVKPVRFDAFIKTMVGVKEFWLTISTLPNT